MSNSDPVNATPKGASVVGGKRRRFTLAITFLILGIVAGILAIVLPPSSAMIACRGLAFLFGLLFVLFLCFGLLGRVGQSSD